nr:MAG TPA: hypothetical protein [Caudoviricetes sp.]
MLTFIIIIVIIRICIREFSLSVCYSTEFISTESSTSIIYIFL